MLKYEIKKILGNKFIPIFFFILFVINLFLSHYAVPRSMEELNLHTDVDEEVQAIMDDLYARYEVDPEGFMTEFLEYKVENWLVNDSGGEIWYRQNTDDELTLFTVMKTDGIPDAIRAIAAMDGKTIVVTYSSYKDFANVYNQYQKITEDNLRIRYAVIDLETGAVYKNDLVY